jgi:uncharacterized tellurite resistance protein B-like protein
MNTELIVDNTEVLASKTSGINFTSEKEATIALFALVEALSFEVLSGDVWWLANHSAKKKAVETYGISEESYEAVMKKLEDARKQVRKGNPLHTMF